jgi:hypothetical protein
MNPILRKRAETYLLSECVSHKEWRALIVEILADVRELCPSCAMTRGERMAYKDGCPMNYPAQGCPFYDPPRVKPAPWETDVTGRGHVPPRPLPKAEP